jgi:hypothetical protein
MIKERGIPCARHTIANVSVREVSFLRNPFWCVRFVGSRRVNSRRAIDEERNNEDGVAKWVYEKDKSRERLREQARIKYRQYRSAQNSLKPFGFTSDTYQR